MNLTALKAIKSRKAAGLDEIALEVWKIKKFDNLLTQLCNSIYNQIRRNGQKAASSLC